MRDCGIVGTGPRVRRRESAGPGLQVHGRGSAGPGLKDHGRGSEESQDVRS